MREQHIRNTPAVINYSGSILIIGHKNSIHKYIYL